MLKPKEGRPMPHNDRIVKSVQRCDPKIFEKFVKRILPKAINYARKLLPQGDYESLVMDQFMNVYIAITKERIKTDQELERFLFKCIKNGKSNIKRALLREKRTLWKLRLYGKYKTVPPTRAEASSESLIEELRNDTTSLRETYEWWSRLKTANNCIPPP
jgi:DNA-directed RNA polymerase specialized sigma24 family protein